MLHAQEREEEEIIAMILRLHLLNHIPRPMMSGAEFVKLFHLLCSVRPDRYTIINQQCKRLDEIQRVLQRLAIIT